MTQNLKDLYHTLDRNLAPFANKENITEKELEMIERAVCSMEKIKKIESIEAEMSRGMGNYSGRYGYGYGVSYPSHHQQWPMSYDGDESYRRSRNAMGQFTSNDGRMMDDHYSGHSFNDRTITTLEDMMRDAPSEEDRRRLREIIDNLRRNPV